MSPSYSCISHPLMCLLCLQAVATIVANGLLMLACSFAMTSLGIVHRTSIDAMQQAAAPEAHQGARQASPAVVAFSDTHAQLISRSVAFKGAAFPTWLMHPGTARPAWSAQCDDFSAAVQGAETGQAYSEMPETSLRACWPVPSYLWGLLIYRVGVSPGCSPVVVSRWQV